MGRNQKMPGLSKRGKLWHIDKKVGGRRLCESTGTSSFEEAQQYLVKRLEDIRQAAVYGVRPKRIFREAAIRYLSETSDKSSHYDEACTLEILDDFIGDLPLEAVHMGSLQSYIQDRKRKTRKRKNGKDPKNKGKALKNRTINAGLQVVRQILNLAAGEWLDEHGLTWLATAPKIKLLPEKDKEKPYPLNREEQAQLFNQLSPHLRSMALFAVNTGCRSREVCRLKWEWEVKIPELNTSVFIIPAENVKNREDRLVVLNEIAKKVIEENRGVHPEFVFTYQSKPILRMYNNGWKKARIRAGLLKVRVHDLKHTFGRRLRAAGVSFEDRQDLLGHRSGRITTHYSAAELSNLIRAANLVCMNDRDEEANIPSNITLLMLRHSQRHAKVTQRNIANF